MVGSEVTGRELVYGMQEGGAACLDAGQGEESKGTVGYPWRQLRCGRAGSPGSSGTGRQVLADVMTESLKPDTGNEAVVGKRQPDGGL